MKKNNEIEDGMDIMKGVWKVARIVMLIIICLCIGSLHGERQVKGFDITIKHHQQELEGYKYCPYCGEKLEGTNNVQ